MLYGISDLMSEKQNITLSVGLTVGETEDFRRIKRYLEDLYGGLWANTRVVKEVLNEFKKTLPLEEKQ